MTGSVPQTKIEDALGRLAAIVKERGASVATAESCTGGGVAAALIRRAGASDYFTGGVVAYSNEVKIGLLRVAGEDIERHGAVSREVAEAMARGARRLTGASHAVATTGIAGPGGGTPAKPVGTVWIAVDTPAVVASKLFHFEGTRTQNIESATSAAIEMLVGVLEGV